jgi:hypothetical protein
LKTFYPDITDEQISQTLAAARKGSTDVITSSILKDAGIPGIRYLDQGSRGSYRAQTTYKGKPYGDVVSFATQKQLDDYVAEKTAEGFGVNKLPQSSNFVVFPGEESKLRIMEVNGRPVVIDEEELRRSGLLGQGVAQ